MDVCFDCVRVFLALVAMKNKVTVLGVSDVCCSRLKGSISEMIPLPSFIELFFSRHCSPHSCLHSPAFVHPHSLNFVSRKGQFYAQYISMKVNGQTFDFVTSGWYGTCTGML